MRDVLSLLVMVTGVCVACAGGWLAVGVPGVMVVAGLLLVAVGWVAGQ